MKCVFCEKCVGYKRYGVINFEPLNPVTEGHMLFIPTTHVSGAGDNPAITAMVMAEAAKFAEENYTDYNLITSVGHFATQTVKHLHIHVVPRRANDGLKLPWTNQKENS